MTLNAVPLQNREWLRQFRKLKGYTLHGVAAECGISHLTYMSVECGGSGKVRACTVKTLNLVASKLGVKLELFYLMTDEEGKLTDRSAIMDILTLFASNGYKSIIYSEVMIRTIFSNEVAEYIVSNILTQVKQKV